MHRMDYSKIIVKRRALNGNFVFHLKALMYWKIIMGFELEHMQKGSYIICFDEL